MRAIVPLALIAGVAAAGKPRHRAVVLVIDRSDSMQGARIDAVKEAARAACEVLDPDDALAIVTFADQADVAVQIQPAGQRAQIRRRIDRISTGGGSNVYPALDAAFDELRDLAMPVKQVIVVTDGESPFDGVADLVHDMHAAHVTISSIGIAGADRNLLQQIADGGAGRLYMVEDLGALPRVVLQELRAVH